MLVKTATKESLKAVELAIQSKANQFALTKIKSDAERKDFAPGVYPVDVTVRVQGNLTVGDDYERTPTVSIPLKETLALALKRMGFQRDGVMAIMREVYGYSIDKTGKGKDALKNEIAELDSWIEVVEKEVLKTLPKAKVNGPVSAKLKVTCLSEG